MRRQSLVLISLALLVVVIILVGVGLSLRGRRGAPASTVTSLPSPTTAAAPTELPTVPTEALAEPTQAPATAAEEIPATPVVLPEDYTEITVTDGGTIQGVVTFAGTPPEPRQIPVTKDQDVFGATLPDERLIVSEDGKIKNAVVFIAEIIEGKPLPKTLPAITNKGGRFEPHVQVFPQREFLIRSEDPVLHNTHPYLGLKEEGGMSQYNVSLSRSEGDPPKEVRRSLKRPGMYQIRCDAHDWMRAWIWVLDHPYGVVTGDDGTFTLTDVPPGTYTLMAWHEELEIDGVEKEITVEPGATVEVNFEF